MPQMDILKRLQENRDEKRVLEARLIALQAERDPLIRQAVEADLSQRRIADAAGLSKTRVQEILDE